MENQENPAPLLSWSDWMQQLSRMEIAGNLNKDFEGSKVLISEEINSPPRNHRLYKLHIDLIIAKVPRPITPIYVAYQSIKSTDLDWDRSKLILAEPVMPAIEIAAIEMADFGWDTCRKYVLQSDGRELRIEVADNSANLRSKRRDEAYRLANEIRKERPLFMSAVNPQTMKFFVEGKPDTKWAHKTAERIFEFNRAYYSFDPEYERQKPDDSYNRRHFRGWARQGHFLIGKGG
jgi:hypothetical protein